MRRALVAILLLTGCGGHLPSGRIALDPPASATRGDRRFTVQRFERRLGHTAVELEIASPTALEIPIDQVRLMGAAPAACTLAIVNGEIGPIIRVPAGRTVAVRLHCAPFHGFREEPGGHEVLAPIALEIGAPPVRVVLADPATARPEWRQSGAVSGLLALRVGGRLGDERSLEGILDGRLGGRWGRWIGEVGARFLFGQALQPIAGAHVSAARLTGGPGLQIAFGPAAEGRFVSAALLGGLGVLARCTGFECAREEAPISGFLEARIGARPPPTAYPRPRPLSGTQLSVTLARELYDPLAEIQAPRWHLSVGVVWHPADPP